MKSLPTAQLLHADITYKLRGIFFTVYNELGFGHKELLYQKALVKEFDAEHIPYLREHAVKVSYKGEYLGLYVPDFIIADKIILEIKAIEFLPQSAQEQILHYLKTTGFELGLLVNFGSSKIFIKRLVNQNPRKSAINQRESLANGGEQK